MNRLPRETAPAYEAFRTYCEMGADRSIRHVARKLSKSATLIGKWSRTHGWVDRAAEYDRHMQEIAQNAEEKKLANKAGLWTERMEKAREKAYQQAGQLSEKAEAMLKFPLAETKTDNGKTVIKPCRWNIADAAKMLDVANKLMQLATGLPTDRHEHSGPGGKDLPAGNTQVLFYVPSNGRDESDSVIN